MAGKIDARSQLPIVNLPPTLPSFADLQGCVLYWVGEVKKVSRNGKEVPTVLLLGDSGAYLCKMDSTVTRYSPYSALSQLVVRDQDTLLGFAHKSAADVDLLIRVPSGSSNPFDTSRALDRVIEIIRRIHWVHSGKDLPVEKIHKAESLSTLLRLAKPAEWNLKIEPMRTTKFLERMLSDQNDLDLDNEEHIHEEFSRLKRDLLLELQTERNNQYDQLLRLSLEYFMRISELEGKPLSSRSESGPGNEGLAQPKGLPYSDPRTAGCVECSRLKALLEEHPNADKKRLLAAEQQCITLNEQLKSLKEQLAPSRKELETLRTSMSKIDSILRDESVSASERMKSSLLLLTPIVHGDSVGAVSAGYEEPSATAAEITGLRLLIREMHANHSAEIEKLKSAFREYDREMVKTVSSLLGEATPVPSRQSERIVTDARSQVLRSNELPSPANATQFQPSPIQRRVPLPSPTPDDRPGPGRVASPVASPSGPRSPGIRWGS
jgi:hypothetical protein